jgi:hypothetical protein
MMGLPTPPETIFDSDDLLEEEASGYTVSMATDSTGRLRVAVIDHESGEIVEMPADVALLAAEAIQEKVRFSKSVLN